MRRDDAIRVRHMLEAALEARQFAAGVTRQNLAADRKLTLALLKDIEIIGEAAAKISEETRENHPLIPWTMIVAMRNHLVHVYFDIDTDRVFETVNDDLPPLIANLEKILAAHPV